MVWHEDAGTDSGLREKEEIMAGKDKDKLQAEAIENNVDAEKTNRESWRKDSVYGLLGKSLDMYHMKFAVYKK